MARDMIVPILKLWQDSKIWLGGTGVGLVLLHLLLIWKLTGQTEQILLSGLFWFAIAQKIWRRRQHIQWRSNRGADTLGLMLIGIVLAKSLSLFWVEASFIRLLPGLIALSLGLLTNGWRLQQFWRELLLLFPLILPKGLILHHLEAAIGLPIRILTAQFSGFALHYLGFTVLRQGTVIELPNGTIDILFGCTGIPLLILLLQLAILLITLFSVSPDQYIRILVATVIIAFVISSLRIMLLAIVVADASSFDYWHDSGAQVFSTVAIILLGGFCHPLLHRVQYPSTAQTAALKINE